MTEEEERTLITGEAEARRATLMRYVMRSAAHRIAAECENMLEHLHAPERETWRDAVGEALVASRHVLSLVAPQNGGRGETVQTSTIAAPQERIVLAMGRLLHLIPVTPQDELIQRAARAVRETALDLLISRDDDATGDPETVAEAAAQALALPRILVVDDEAMVREPLSRMLHRLGHEVLGAANGRAAFEIALREKKLDLIITDINMPEMDGIELLTLLKNDARTRDIPVIVISSQDDRESVASCIERGAEDHITKPYDAVLLQARVRASLERKRMRDLETDYLRRVAELTSAAEAVEQEVYSPGSLQHLAEVDDELGRLARVFDRMVTALKSREERLHLRLRQLRTEMGASSDPAGSMASISLESPLASGEMLGGRYEIRGELGRGGMGLVYRAFDRELGEEVAIKLVRGDLVASNPSLVDRLKSEIRLARRLPHRNIVRAHDLGEWKGTYFITMEYVEGISVKDLINRRGRLTVESTLAIGTQLADALVVAHEADIIHRDIKPENLLIDNTGCLKVTDFGLARPLQQEMRITAGGFILGTPQYMAPEQFRGSGAIDARSDLYAVGVVLYECLSGKPPFDADSVTALYAEVMKGTPTLLTELVPETPPSLALVIHQLIQRKPADRVPSARELVRRLAEAEASRITP
jgi:CheY-like chemotaxis protein